MRLTKLDMARVIVTALYNLPQLASASNPEVIRRASRGKLATLTSQHKKALAAIESKQGVES